MGLKQRFFHILLFAVSCAFIACGGSKKTTSSHQRSGDGLDPAYQDMFFNAQLEKVRGNSAAAYNRFMLCANMDPSIAASFYELSVLCLQANKPREAMEFAEKCVNLDPENPWYHRQLGNALMEMGEYEKAIKRFSEVCALKPEDLDALYDLATAQLFANQYKEVMSTYDRIERQAGVYEELSMQKHAIYRDVLKDQDKAAHELTELIKAYPGESSYVTLATEYLRSIGRDEEAMQLIREAQKLNPSDGRMQFQLSEYYAAKGQDSLSFAYLKSAFSTNDLSADQRIAVLLRFYNLSENNPLAKERAYILLNLSEQASPNEPKLLAMYGDYCSRDQRLQDAITYYRRALTLDPTRHPVWMQTLALELETRDFTSMLVDASRAVEYYPTTADFYYYKGFANYRLLQFQEAIEQFETGKELVVDDLKLLIRFYERLGMSFHRAGKFQQAEEAFKYALALNDNADIILCSYALVLAERNERIDLAEEMVNKGMQRNKTYPDFLHAYAYVQFRRGNYSAALEAIEKVVLSDASWDVMEHYGDILSRLNRSNEALVQWRRAKEMGSTSKTLDQKIREAKWSE